MVKEPGEREGDSWGTKNVEYREISVTTLRVGVCGVFLKKVWLL